MKKDTKLVSGLPATRGTSNKLPRYFALAAAATALGLSVGIQAEELVVKPEAMADDGITEREGELQQSPESQPAVKAPTATQFKSLEPGTSQYEAVMPSAIQHKSVSPR